MTRQEKAEAAYKALSRARRQADEVSGSQHATLGDALRELEARVGELVADHDLAIHQRDAEAECNRGLACKEELMRDALAHHTGLPSSTEVSTLVIESRRRTHGERLHDDVSLAAEHWRARAYGEGDKLGAFREETARQTGARVSDGDEALLVALHTLGEAHRLHQQELQMLREAAVMVLTGRSPGQQGGEYEGLATGELVERLVEHVHGAQRGAPNAEALDEATRVMHTAMDRLARRIRGAGS